MQAFGLGLVAALTGPDTRLVTAYVILLLVGWAGGVVVGHVGKLLSLSLWVWWPPAPRPKQSALYPRRLGLLEAGSFLIGVEALMIGVLAGSATLARGGAGVLYLSAVATVAGVNATWRRRAGSAP